MADCFEDTETSDSGLECGFRTDTDRRNDNRNFRRDQFNIFKHNYRAAVKTERLPQNNSDDESGSKLLTLNVSQKKSIVNMIRKLQKAENSLELKNGNQLIRALIIKLNKTKTKLMFLISANVDFSPQNAPLPDFDLDDIHLLFGTDVSKISDQNYMKYLPEKWSFETKQRLESNVLELIGAGEILLNECDEIK